MSRSGRRRTTAADELERRIDAEGSSLYSIDGLCWAAFLARTGRIEAGLRLTRESLEFSLHYGWPQDAAWHQRLFQLTRLRSPPAEPAS